MEAEDLPFLGVCAGVEVWEGDEELVGVLLATGTYSAALGFSLKTGAFGFSLLVNTGFGAGTSAGAASAGRTSVWPAIGVTVTSGLAVAPLSSGTVEVSLQQRMRS